MLSNMNAQKLRLLAYESILYLVETLNYKSENEKCLDKAVAKNKIEHFLSEIQNTLLSIKEILNRFYTDKESLLKDHKRNIS